MTIQTLQRPAKLEQPMPLAEKVDPKSTALVVVDVQNDFCLPTGICARAGADITPTGPMVANIKVLVEAARNAGVLIVYVRTSYDSPVLSPPLAESQFMRRGFTGICYVGSEGYQFVDGIGPAPGAPNETIVEKHRYSAFWGTRMDLILRSNGIRTLVMSGVATDVCVESTLRDGFFRDYHIVEAADAVATFEAARHEASQRRVERAFGPVVPMAEIIGVWQAATTTERNWQPATKYVGMLRTLEEQVAPENAALVLVDVQNDFCHPLGTMRRRGGSFDMVDRAVPRIRALLERAREVGMRVIHVKAQYGAPIRHVGSPHRYPADNRDGFTSCLSGAEFVAYEDRFDDPVMECCHAGSWGGQFVEGIVPLADEPVVVKHRYSGFVDTRLETILRSNGIRSVVLAGVTTNCCVESTARDALMRDFYVVVADDCVATKDEHADLHAGSLESLRNHFAQVVPSKDIFAAWPATQPAPLRATA